MTNKDKMRLVVETMFGDVPEDFDREFSASEKAAKAMGRELEANPFDVFRKIEADGSSHFVIDMGNYWAVSTIPHDWNFEKYIVRVLPNREMAEAWIRKNVAGMSEAEGKIVHAILPV